MESKSSLETSLLKLFKMMLQYFFQVEEDCSPIMIELMRVEVTSIEKKFCDMITEIEEKGEVQSRNLDEILEMDLNLKALDQKNREISQKLLEKYEINDTFKLYDRVESEIQSLIK
jgi:hypothetical protein